MISIYLLLDLRKCLFGLAKTAFLQRKNACFAKSNPISAAAMV